MDGNVRKILSRLESQCARREYCSSDVLRKAAAALRKAGLPETLAGGILESLVSGGYVDDLRYAQAFCRDKSSLTGWGPLKIRLALSAKKIDAGIIGEALAGTDADRASERLRKLAEAKRKSLEGDPQARLKLLKYLLSRGYEYDEVRRFADGRDD